MSDIPSQPSAGYWLDTERQIRISNHRDRQAARAVNANNILLDAVPFGTIPEQLR